ncbi:MAG: hypothetical protein N3B13_11605, partial [Deltaproteobacteria bacterium]|nr:hypothetical protein [Deltaproteobacteria bacterium]
YPFLSVGPLYSNGPMFSEASKDNPYRLSDESDKNNIISMSMSHARFINRIITESMIRVNQ